MEFLGYIFAFYLAIVTFYINHRIQRMINMKIIFNSLFDIYAKPESFNNFDVNEVSKRLMDEIIDIEKLNDNNLYINEELYKLKKLRLVYFHFRNKKAALKEIDNINFNRLGRSFIILCFLNIRISYFNKLNNGLLF